MSMTVSLVRASSFVVDAHRCSGLHLSPLAGRGRPPSVALRREGGRVRGTLHTLGTRGESPSPGLLGFATLSLGCRPLPPSGERWSPPPMHGVSQSCVGI